MKKLKILCIVLAVLTLTSFGWGLYSSRQMAGARRSAQTAAAGYLLRFNEELQKAKETGDTSTLLETQKSNLQTARSLLSVCGEMGLNSPGFRALCDLAETSLTAMNYMEVPSADTREKAESYLMELAPYYEEAFTNISGYGYDEFQAGLKALAASAQEEKWGTVHMKVNELKP